MVLPRIYPILDTASFDRLCLRPETVAAAWLEAGAGILQFRHKRHFSRAVFETAAAVARMCRQAAAVFIVDDRADIAALLGAGVHLGQDDLPPAAARRIAGSEAVLGFSTHNEEQLRAATLEPADYLALGPIFGTSSKENPDPVVGVDGLARLRPLSARPLVAIGGITLETAPDVFAAGADSIALIGALLPPEPSPRALRARMEEWLELAR